MPLIKAIPLAVFATLTSLAQSQELVNENLIQTVPPSYKIANQFKRGNMLMTEFIPQRESLENWTEMVTTQVFLGLKQPTPAEFRKVMQSMWGTNCKEANFADVASGQENGYPFELWIQDCPKNERTGKMERVWLKAIKGNDSFYLVQKAFRFQPESEQIIHWTQYLRTIQVCDSRLPDRSCPRIQ